MLTQTREGAEAAGAPAADAAEAVAALVRAEAEAEAVAVDPGVVRDTASQMASARVGAIDDARVHKARAPLCKQTDTGWIMTNVVLRSLRKASVILDSVLPFAGASAALNLADRLSTRNPHHPRIVIVLDEAVNSGVYWVVGEADAGRLEAQASPKPSAPSCWVAAVRAYCRREASLIPSTRWRWRFVS